jgi:aspartyl-tRNA(Asn)/glutamyl-tRNA(Gln) amidotransferase subunit B
MNRPLAPATTWLTVVGLEVHCQLGTHSKLFCACAAEFGAPPNTRACAVCAGLPGTLPIPNAEAVRLALRAGLALGCTIDRASRFDRKHYFYCDLPKGYQITQVERPLATGGGLELASGRRVRLRRIHIEEDAGKAIHDRGAHTLVDLNRAGVPLIEIVSEPDLTSGAETHEYLSALKETLQYARVSECDMEKGSLRCDVNVSVHRRDTPLGTRVELKNLNSFKHVVAALEHEVARQIALLEAGERVRQETRLWDAQRGESRPMRSKEDEDDYRYFPDPDLPPLALAADVLERERADLAEAPGKRRARWQSELGLSAYDAGVLSGSRDMADFFEQTARLSGAPKEAANWLANDVAAALTQRGAAGPSELRLTPARLAELIALGARGALSKAGARGVLAAMLEREGSAQELVAELGLAQVSDAGEIEAWCRSALATAERAAADLRAGEQKALGALIGRVMKASGGRANPELARAELLRLVREDA